MVREYVRILMLTALLGAPLAAHAAPDAAVEVTVTAVEVDAGSKPVIVEVEINLTNRSDVALKGCDVAVAFLDAAGRTLVTKQHALDGLDLKPGAETLASFQDADPPAAWAHKVSIVAKCH
jgi:hypothetical protein